MEPREQKPLLNPPARNFEESMRTLEEIVARLGNPELPLEEALQLFELGVRHLRYCEEVLKRSERRVMLLMEGKEEPFPEPQEP